MTRAARIFDRAIDIVVERHLSIWMFGVVAVASWLNAWPTLLVSFLIAEILSR